MTLSPNHPMSRINAIDAANVAVDADSAIGPEPEPRIQHGKLVPALTVECFAPWFVWAVSVYILPSS